MDFQLSPLQKELQARMRAFAQNEVAPFARQWDENRAMPREIIRRLAELGVLGGPLPREYGGQGWDYVSTAIAYEEIGRACSSTRGFIAVHLGLVSMCIKDWGTEEQKRALLPRLARGEIIGCYALTEPNAGSDVGSMESTATRDGDHYLLNGTKIWISNGNIADVALVFASVDRSLKHRGVTAFIVETSAPGFHREKMEGQELGHRASDHAVIRLQNCRVHKSALLGKEGEGFKVAMGALDHGRLGVAAGAVGVAQACIDACVEFLTKRQQFGQRLADFQMVQQAMADMFVETEAARLLTYKAAALKDAGVRTTSETSAAKLYATEAASRAASKAVFLHGSYGYTNLYPVERYYRDIKGFEIYEGTSFIQRIIIARDLLGTGKK
ncbi:MAG: acyl-CoA dehydrogenase family protein [Candidatus Tectomicrobia bacterium]|uniref:Cyclohex-1-ene-1-carbonyl-CoA dehydrogenase n=1 Tax=Tectimicrobiota bacterium TaxID=2528274 RepID=A0A932GRV6_UNCTE|nr:acyl-CoA dehydrogenase family protein [Candidatus Tectomicrobia bacterium]